MASETSGFDHTMKQVISGWKSVKGRIQMIERLEMIAKFNKDESVQKSASIVVKAIKPELVKECEKIIDDCAEASRIITSSVFLNSENGSHRFVHGTLEIAKILQNLQSLFTK